MLLGPYLSERAWATVREDYSPDGEAWSYFPHEQDLFRNPDWKDKTDSTNISMRTTIPASERATRPAGPAFPPNCFNNSPQSVKNNPPAEN